jgi:single-strand selective monofunctional uracil DNA glycosylase
MSDASWAKKAKKVKAKLDAKKAPKIEYRAPTTPLGTIAATLRDAVDPYVDRAPHETIDCILNPLEYAWERHLDYLERHAPPGEVEAVFVGMNPGPFGMAQTGVPFGSPDLVRDFLGISGPVRQPRRCHAERPIEGFEGKRTEVSGQRLWGAVRDCFGAPQEFFRRFFVLNYCPLVLQSESGANLTPDKASAEFMAECMAACDQHLAETLKVLRPKTVIGVGKWAEQRAAKVIAAHGLDAKVASILHPSPASPAANKDWLGTVRKQLDALGHGWPAPKV